MALLTVPVARALVADLLDAMAPSDAVIVLEQLRRRYAPPRPPADLTDRCDGLRCSCCAQLDALRVPSG